MIRPCHKCGGKGRITTSCSAERRDEHTHARETIMSKANRKPTGEKKSAKKGETTPSKTKRAKKGAPAAAAQHEEPTVAPTPVVETPAPTTDEGRSDAARLARGARRLRVRGTQLAPPARATEIDVVEADVSPLDVLRVRADVARDRVEMLDAVAELGLYAAQVAHLAADAWRFDGQRLDTTDSVEALTLATALARKAGAL